jgi:hypothetical protein
MPSTAGRQAPMVVVEFVIIMLTLSLSDDDSYNRVCSMFVVMLVDLVHSMVFIYTCTVYNM